MTSRLSTMLTLGDCEDCTSYKELDEIRPGMFYATTIHDPSCPTYQAAVRARNGAS